MFSTNKPSYSKDKKCWQNIILLSIKNIVGIEKCRFFLYNCFLIEEAISHSEIICIEISIICMISILIVFFPNDNQESHWPRKVLIRALAHNIPLKYYKSRDQLPGNQGSGRDWFSSQSARNILQLPVWISPLTGLGVVSPEVMMVVVVTTWSLTGRSYHRTDFHNVQWVTDTG